MPERRDIDARWIAGLATGLLLLLALLLIGLQTLQHFAAPAQPSREPHAGVDSRVPGPRLQESPKQALKQLHAAEDRVLQRYGWVDREAGIAQIPIDRAMQIVAEHGLPVFPDEPESTEEVR